MCTGIVPGQGALYTIQCRHSCVRMVVQLPHTLSAQGTYTLTWLMLVIVIHQHTFREIDAYLCTYVCMYVHMCKQLCHALTQVNACTMYANVLSTVYDGWTSISVSKIHIHVLNDMYIHNYII